MVTLDRDLIIAMWYDCVGVDVWHDARPNVGVKNVSEVHAKNKRKDGLCFL